MLKTLSVVQDIYMENNVHPIVYWLMNLNNENLGNYQVILSICDELILPRINSVSA